MIHKLVIRRDMGFIYNNYSRLLTFYIRHLVQYNLHGLQAGVASKGKHYTERFDDNKYNKLLDMLVRIEHKWRDIELSSLFDLCVAEPPSVHEAEYFDFNTNVCIIERLKHDQLVNYDINEHKLAIERWAHN